MFVYRELRRGKRPRHIPKKHFNDVVKNNVRALFIDLGDSEQMMENRSVWLRK